LWYNLFINAGDGFLHMKSREPRRKFVLFSGNLYCFQGIFTLLYCPYCNRNFCHKISWCQWLTVASKSQLSW